MRKLLAMLSVLLVAGAAWGGSSSESTSKATYDVSFIYDASDGTSAIDNDGSLTAACRSGTAYLEPGSTGTVTLYGVKNRTGPWTLDSTTQLAVVSGTTASTGTTFTNVARYFQAAATVSGTGQLRIKCANTASSGGGGGSANPLTTVSCSGGVATIPGTSGTYQVDNTCSAGDTIRLSAVGALDASDGKQVAVINNSGASLTLDAATNNPGSVIESGSLTVPSDSTFSAIQTAANVVEVIGTGGSVNVAIDTDGDGNPDTVTVRGDYNGDGSVTLEDIYDAANALTDTGAKSLRVEGTFDSSALTAATFWDTTNLIELDAFTTMECAPNARLFGPSLAFWKARSAATRLISNADGVDGVHVRNCFIENTALLTPFDGDTASSDWQTSLFGGIHFTRCDGCSAVGNTVRGSPHSGFFMSASSSSIFEGNIAYATGETFNHRGNGTTTLDAGEPASETVLSVAAVPTNCAVDDWVLIELDSADPDNSSLSNWDAGWIEATAAGQITIRRAAYASGRNPGLTEAAALGNIVFCPEGDKHAYETFTEGGVVARRNVIRNNTARLISGVSFFLRGVNLGENNCEDSTQTTCWHEDTLITGNTATDTNGELFMVRGSRGAVIDGNIGTRTGGVTFTVSNDVCSAPFDDTGTGSTALECSTNTKISNNVIRDCKPNLGSTSSVGGCVRFNDGHEGVAWESTNIIDGNIGGNAYLIAGNVSNSRLDMVARNIASACLADGIGTGSPVSSPLFGSLDCTWAGLEAATGSVAFFWRSLHTADFTLDPFSINGVNGTAVWIQPLSGNLQAPTMRNVNIIGHGAGYSGTDTEINLLTSVECNASYAGVHVISTNASSATDCTFASGTGSTENRCRCDGSAFVDFNPAGGRDVIEWSSTNTTTGGGVFGGTIQNTGTSNVRLISAGSAVGIVDGFSIVDVKLKKGPVGMLTADNVLGIDEGNASFTDLTVRGVSFDGITDANRYLSFSASDDAVYEALSPSSRTEAGSAVASGSCSTGAIYHNLAATASPAISVCRNGAWAAMD